jgi:hypothetical protein
MRGAPARHEERRFREDAVEVDAEGRRRDGDPARTSDLVRSEERRG